MFESQPTTRRKLAGAMVVLPLLAAILAINVPFRAASAAATPAEGLATWGIRGSYRSYINGAIAHGTTTVSDGATWTDGTGTGKGPFTFPVADATFDEATETGLISFDGTVYTGGHDYGDGYILEAEWTNLRLDVDGDVGTIIADLTFRPFVGANPNIPPPAQQQASDVDFATLDLSGVDGAVSPDGLRTIDAAPAVGVVEAMELIGWDLFYEADMPTIGLDDFSLSFIEAIDDTTTTTEGGTTSTTSAPTTTTTAPITTTTAPSTTTAPEPIPTESTITGGEMSWGVYQTFVNYVNGPIAHGTITTGAGATGAPTGPFLFPAVTGDEVDVTAANLELSFTGSVQFTGHVYEPSPPALEMRFENFRVEKTGNSGKLFADVTSRPFIDMNSVAEPETFLNAHLADLDFSQVTVGRHGDGVAWLQVPAKVSAGGAPLFGGFYEAGQQLDPVTIALTLSAVPEGLGEATPPPTPAGPTVVLGASSVAAGGTITVSSEGFTPGEQIEVWIHSTPTYVQMVRADMEGRVSAAVTIPAETTPGTHRLELRGLSSGISAFSPYFQVTAGARSLTGSRNLPRTGSDNIAAVALGLGLILAGAAAVAPSRLRRAR